MPIDEPIDHFAIYESKVRSSLQPGAPARTYRQQISSHLLRSEKALEATEIRKITVNKSTRGTNILSCLRRKSLRTYLLSSNDHDGDDDNDENSIYLKHIYKYIFLTRFS